MISKQWSGDWCCFCNGSKGLMVNNDGLEIACPHCVGAWHKYGRFLEPNPEHTKESCETCIGSEEWKEMVAQ